MKDGLIFEWPGRHHLQVLLPATLAGAAVVHAGLFFLFSIIYPRQESAPLDGAKVYFVVSGTPESERLSALLKSADPSVFGPGRGLVLADVANSGNYTPQYDTARVALDPLPAGSAVVPKLFAAAGPVPVVGPTEARKPSGPRPPTVRLTAAGALDGRAPVLPPDHGLLPPAGSNPGSAVFLAAVLGDGSVAHVFSQRSSGSEELDRKAEGILRGLRFSSGPESLAWGFVTFQWGTPAAP